MFLVAFLRTLTPTARQRVRGMALTALGLGSIVLSVFLLAGVWGFLALGVALLALDWSLDSGNAA
jgi:hypothetical protein